MRLCVGPGPQAYSTREVYPCNRVSIPVRQNGPSASGPAPLCPAAKVHAIAMKVRAQHLTNLIKVAKQCGVGEDFGSIDVMEVRCTTELPPVPEPEPFPSSCWQGCGQRWKEFNSTTLDRMSTLEIHSVIVGNSYISFNHVACITLASGMAAIGLVTDSSVFVLAAFFVSPLMQMVLATVWGLTVQDFALAWRGFRNMCFGALICLALGSLFGLLIGALSGEKDLISPIGDYRGSTSFISINTLQITSRGPPAGNVLMSAIVAALSGMAVALGQGSGISSALIGVCISTSLLPPLVNAGMMWTLQLRFPKLRNKGGFCLSEIGAFSVYLYLTNIVCIVAFAWAAFKFKHIGGRTLRPMARAPDLQEEADPAQITPGVLRAFSRDLSARVGGSQTQLL
ncbi:unnamed protein product [Symbiodinium natans]|uniref:Uncharacterized protein n=1 Tax=Symbiodinium natans TaxID=878477 RepID=A0A812ILJ3_9DINO|nr:unnamed protein product [Symbiodinium natans]